MSRTLKRILDLSVAGFALIILSPVLAAIAGAILMTMGRPIFFRQVRPGLHGRPFTMVKFRTMSDTRGPDGRVLLDRDRISPLGHRLRRTSLDELPELWNILRGDMSLVGPRPLLMRYLERYSPEQARRHDVPPGLTGWAQVNGRRLVQMPERLAYDVWYVDHWSLKLDLKIMAMTVRMVLRGEGMEPPDSGVLDLGWERMPGGEPDLQGGAEEGSR